MASTKYSKLVLKLATMSKMYSLARARSSSYRQKKRTRKPKRTKKTGKMERLLMAKAPTRGRLLRRAEAVAKRRRREDAVDQIILLKSKITYT